MLSALEGREVVQVVTGHQNSLFLTYKGTVLSCGQTSCVAKPEGLSPKQRSLYEKQTEIIFNISPRLLDTGPSKIVRLRSGGNHHGALSLDGTLHLWGYGESGSSLTLDGRPDFQLDPREVTCLKGLQVMEFALADGYSLVSCLEKKIVEVQPIVPLSS